MDKEGFVLFLEKKKKSKRTIHRYVGAVQQFEKYLFEYKSGKQLEKAGTKDLHDFESWGDSRGVQMNRALWGISEGTRRFARASTMRPDWILSTRWPPAMQGR